jgi:autotransporter-associated beta strand protein
LSGADTLTGGLTINGGTLTLDFTTGTTTVLGSQALTLGGGTLNILGANPGPSSQTFSGVTFSSGANTVSAAPTSGTGYPTLTLGTLTPTTGATIEFIGPAMINSSGNVTATAIITTAAGGTGTLGQLTTAAGTAYATVGLYDWATTDTTGGSPGTTINGGSQVTGFYTTLAGGGTVASSSKNYDVTGTTAASSGSSTYTADTLRFNTAVATTFSVASAKNWNVGGILVTPNVGAHNVNFITTGSGANGLNRNYATPLAIFQNNTQGELIFNTTYYYGILGSGAYIQSGPGTVFLDGTAGNNYTGATYLNGGVTEIGPNSNGGAGGPASQLGNGTGANLNVNLNGGTLIGDYTGNLDGASSTAHPVVLGNNGGGLGAVTGTTLTVDGVVSGAAGTGPLVIGIPASSANGSVLGQLPGTSVLATGTLILNNTGNTYTGGTILDSGILQLTVNNLAVLGTGGITLNGGTFQWNGVTTDISSRTITLAGGGGTLDVNGNTVTLANSIGNSGSGALTLEDTAGGGSLTLSENTTYTGATTVGDATHAMILDVNGSLASSGVTVNNNATFGGTGTIVGNVTWANGSFVAKSTPGSPLTVAGAVTLNGNTFTTATALTAGTYTLLTGGSITGGSTVNATPGLGSVAGGYAGVVSISGNSVILTVTSTGTAATWTDGNSDQNWSGAGNWSGGVPHLAGDSATFNSAGGSAVTLNAIETVGGITFNNPSSDVISGAHTLTLDGSGHGATVTVSAGTANAINTSVALNDNTTIVANSGQSLTLGGTVANSSGSKTLTITGGGTNILSSANTYGPSAGSVGTSLGGATVQVGNNTALGSGDVSVTGSSTLQSGAAGLSVANNIAVSSAQTATVDNNGNNLTFGGTISGSGNLSEIGSGTLTLGGNNTYTGNTAIGGALIYNSSAAQTNSGVISGSGTLTQNGSGTLVLSGANTFTNTTTISAGTLTLGNSLALQNSTLNYNSGSLTFSGITAATLAALSGPVDLSLVNDASAAVVLTVGGNNSTTTYSGVLSGIGSLTKNGTGTLTLSGDESLTGALTATGGTLVLSGNNSARPSNANNLTVVNNGGTLQLQANTHNTVSGMSYALSPEETANGPLTLNNGSTLQLRSDSSLTFAGGNTVGGLGSVTTTINVNQLTPAGANNTITFAPGGFATHITTFNVTGGNGYTLVLGPITTGNAGSLTLNANSANLTINGGITSVTALTFGGGFNSAVTGVIAGSGTTTLSKSGAGILTLSGANTYAGATTISAGTLVVNGAGQLGSGTYAAPITDNGTFAYNSSTAQTLSGVISGTGALNQNGSGTLTLAGANTYTGNTVINAGIVNAGVAEVAGVSGPFGVPATVAGSISFGGGTLQYSAANNYDYSGRFVTTGSQPISIDMGGQTVSFATQIQGTGTTLTKSGNGILNLAAAAGNTYTGNTIVNGGTLVVNNASGSGTGSGNVTVASGGTLDGSGIISGNVTVQGGGTLSGNGIVGGILEIQNTGILTPGDGGLGTNTAGALALASGAIANFEFNGSGHDMTVVTGGLTVNGGTFNLYSEGGTLPWTTIGSYTLIQYNGSNPSLDSTWTTASSSNPHVGNAQSSLTYSFTASGGKLTLTIGLSGNTVSGLWTNTAASGSWATAANWSSNPKTPHAAGDFAQLGNGTSLTTVSLDGSKTVGTLTFNNNNSYQIAPGTGGTLTLDNNGSGAVVNVTAGTANQVNTPVALNDNATLVAQASTSVAFSGNIANGTAGNKTLTVSASGTAALSGNNSYGPGSGSYGTYLTGGAILQVGSSTALGTSDVSFAGSSTLQAGTSVGLNNNIDVSPDVTATVDSSGNSLALNGVISDSGNLTKIGNGTLSLPDNHVNPYTGNTTVNGGILSVAYDGDVFYSSKIILNGGDLLGNGQSDNGFMVNIDTPIGIGPTSGSAGGTALIDAVTGTTLDLQGVLASAGNTGTNNLVVNCGAGHNGIVSMTADGSTYNGTTVISNGVLDVASSMPLAFSTLNYNNQGGYLWIDGITSIALGGLTGAQNLGLTNLNGNGVALTVGSNNVSTTYSGNLNDAGLGGALVKAGSGTLTLSGNESFTGQLMVNAGALILSGNNTYTGGTRVNPNAMLQLQATGGNTVSGTNYAMGAASQLNMGGVNGSTSTLQLRSDASVTFIGGNGMGGLGGTGAGETVVIDVNQLTPAGANNTFTLAPLGFSVFLTTINVTGGNGDTLALGPITAVGGAQTDVFNPTNGGNLTINGFTGSSGANVLNLNGTSTGSSVGGVIANGSGILAVTKLGTGTWTLTAANTYTGTTTISSGTLLVNGSIAGAVAVNGGKLGGNSAVGGAVTVNASGMLAPGTSAIGTLTVNNNLTLGGNVLVRLNKSLSPAQSNDMVKVTGTLSYGGTLTVTNIGSALAAGDSFSIFPAGGTGSVTVSGNAGSGLAFSFSPASGVLSVVSAAAPLSGLKFTASPVISGTSLTISATNTGAGTVYLLTSTNVATFINTWTPIWTNVLTGNGSFTTNLLNAVSPALNQQFYILSNTNN